MIVEATMVAAPYLVPFAAGVLVSSLAGLRRARLALAPLPTRIEPGLDPLPPVAVQILPNAVPVDDVVAGLPEVRRRMAPRLIVSQARAAEILVEFMNSEGQSGLFTAKEIDEWWGFAAAARDIEHLTGYTVREALDCRGLKLGQRRLNNPEYIAVRQRTGQTRPVLYRIPKVRTQAGTSPDAPASSRSDRQSSSPRTGSQPDAVPMASQEAA